MRSLRLCRIVAGAATLIVLLGTLQADNASAYTLESPEVKAMVKKATSYLGGIRKANYGEGGDALIALALYKAGESKSHPKIQFGLERARKAASKGIGHSVYNSAISCIALCEMDPKGSAAEINNTIQGMIKRQRPNGAWGYEPFTGDDNSQTQYGILCLWSAFYNGFDVPADAVERAANWLIRTQDVNGGYTYMSHDPGTFQRIQQSSVTHSMSAAGVGSLFVAAHLLGFAADPDSSKEKDDGLPPALVKVEEKKEKEEGNHLQPTMTSAQHLRSAQMLGNRWFAQHLTYDIKKWTHYYMYAVERYKSLQELVEGNRVDEPDWYNRGVEYLQRTQAGDGSWKTEESHGSGPPVDTAFAILFLTRSTQKTIGDVVLNEGTLIGGYGLPKNTTNIRINEDGQVVTPQMVQDVDDLLELIKSAEDTEFDATTLPGGLTLDQDLNKRTSQLVRLREMVTDEDFNTRFAAVKTLATARELDNVPALIFALSDPNPRIAREARDGLRFISRKFYGFRLPDEPTVAQVQAAQAKWEEWYLSIRPDAELME